MFSLSTQSLASCVNYFVWNCLTCFSNTKIGSVTSFSILFNFQGPVAPQPSGLRLDYFITEVIFCQALFSKFFAIQISLVNLERSLFLGAGRNFRTSIGSFRFTSSWDSEVILLSQRLALKYNTICRATLQAFFTSFLLFFRFCIHPLVFRLKSVPALTPTQHTCGVRLLPVGVGVALYIIRRASTAFTGQTDALSYI